MLLFYFLFESEGRFIVRSCSFGVAFMCVVLLFQAS